MAPVLRGRLCNVLSAAYTLYGNADLARDALFSSKVGFLGGERHQR